MKKQKRYIVFGGQGQRRARKCRGDYFAFFIGFCIICALNLIQIVALAAYLLSRS